MSAQSAEELALAQLLVQSLNLDGIEPGAIAPDAALFGQNPGSLGLDSIDALEIALAISQKYGVELKSDDEATKKSFASLRALSAFVQQKRVGQ
ncbi:phosphopantetheine-binding protein [Stenotrophobium rhamnosiphilum]|uniref:Acyl carrier protein n=1 Tax=Stenotrophobium rhamnosiphilum TaxID=2029166 RepID=A0A2T5MFP1_9GAMM|nr:phosphopantetheine-binding protein [Stenotrophobium rhamnosiphilum]PTU31394.1 acyl carrier protein [Stenotrophobium rhamnosiphilum]